MRRVLACVVACLIGLQPAAVWAQQSAPSIDSLGLSFARIKRELRTLPPSTAQTPLKLEYYVEVQGLAPPIPIFRPGELTSGPVPYGAPTHSDMMSHVTPEEFKSPRIPVSGIVIMGLAKLLQWEAARAREERREKDRQTAIEAERERQRRLKESVLLSPPK
ncbi:MAG: hypothetical protein R6V57_09730 [Vicinamibacterales bacterium]